MIARRGAVALAVFVLMIIGGTGSLAQETDRLQPEALTYLGAFLPPDDAPEDVGWWYAGHALAFNPAGDPTGPDDGFPGSLFGTGHDWYQYVSEVSIPVPLITPALDALPVATTLQPFADVRGEMFGELEQPVAALEVLPGVEGAEGRLVFAWGQHFQEMRYGPSHGWSRLDLADPQSAGPWSVGDFPDYLTNNYLFTIPAEWAAHTPGMTLATGRFREGGQGGSGPSLIAFAPPDVDDPAPAGAVLPALALLRYGDYTTPGEQQLDDYRHCDDWTGGAWLTAGERAAVIFVGTKALGECWYGFANGIVWPEEGPWPDVPEWPYDNRGYWASEYEEQMLFYDPADLAAVAAGTLEPWQPQPYARLDISDVFFGVREDWTRGRAGSAAYDRERGLLYVTEPTADDSGRTVIHVWRVG
ncbi:MAG: hypothetical protein JW910_05920 [Anaerolineae bacterium]|nr:hypothetical protein [Anaerolineae bacterium]